MDTDLFQILALILLLGLLLTLFGVLQSLGAIRKALERGGAAAPAETTPAAQPHAGTAAGGEEQPATWARPVEETATAAAGAEPAAASTARSGWPAPQEAAASESPAAEGAAPAASAGWGASEAPASSGGWDASETSGAQPAAAEAPAASGSGGRVLYGDSGLTTATPSEAALQTSETAEPADTTAAASAGGTGATTGAGSGEAAAAGGEAASATQAAAEDPQEQPFERDGRWWFRRGDELLVYEEQTGQWVAADQPSTSGSVASGAEPGVQATGGAEPAQAAAEGQVTTQQEAVAGSFWKCPSCGAVNGSTATSCRMCFTARP